MNIGGSKIIKKSANLVMQYIRKDAERILITYLIDLRRGKFFFHSGDQSRKSRIILHFQTTLNSVKIRSDGNGIDSGKIGDVPQMMDDLFISATDSRPNDFNPRACSTGELLLGYPIQFS